MQENFNEFISKIQNLPDLITPEMLVKLGIGNHTILFRLRQNGEIPFIKLSSARILYLKSDVIDWLKKSYTKPKENSCCKKINETERKSECDYYKMEQS